MSGSWSVKGGALPRRAAGFFGCHPAATAHEGPAPAARRLAGASVSPNTRRAYARAPRRLDAWLAASALVEAEPRFRRVQGYRDLRYLVGALDGRWLPDNPDNAVAAVTESRIARCEHPGELYRWPNR